MKMKQYSAPITLTIELTAMHSLLDVASVSVNQGLQSGGSGSAWGALSPERVSSTLYN